jgi:hypothetical protein
MAILGLDISHFERNAQKATHVGKSAGHEIAHSWGNVLSEKLAEFASVGFAEETIRRVVELGEKVYDLSRRLGISTDAVQAWDYALKLNGSSIQEAVGFFEKLGTSRQKALAGNDEMIAAYRRLGVSISDLKHSRLEDIALKIAATYEGGDPQKLIADLRSIGGRGAGEMAAAFRAGLPELIAGAKEAGVIISESVINDLKEAADSAKTIWMEFLAGIAPAVAGLGRLLSHLWHDANVIVNGAVGFITGGVSGAKELMHEYDEESKRREEAQAERRKKSGERLEGGAGDVPENESTATKHAKHLLQLKEELFRLQQDNDLKSLSREGQILELTRRRAAIIATMSNPNQTEEGKINAAIAVEKINSELRGLKVSGSVETLNQHHRRDGGELSSLQRMGGGFVYKSEHSEIGKQILHEVKRAADELAGKHKHVEHFSFHGLKPGH